MSSHKEISSFKATRNFKFFSLNFCKAVTRKFYARNECYLWQPFSFFFFSFFILIVLIIFVLVNYVNLPWGLRNCHKPLPMFKWLLAPYTIIFLSPSYNLSNKVIIIWGYFGWEFSLKKKKSILTKFVKACRWSYDLSVK